MVIYKKLIPNFLNISEYSNIKFTLEMYNYILYLKFNSINKWSKYNNLTTISNDDEFIIIFYDNKISYISSYYKKHNVFPLKIIINKNQIIARLINNIIKDRRYISFIILVSDKNYHVLNLIFDNYKLESYLIECQGVIHEKIHKIMEYYVSSMGYKYKKLEILNINNKIKSKKQKSFFKGYCMGWSLFFKYLAEKADINFEMTDYLLQLSLYKNKGPLFELIELFQVWFYTQL
jgi:hypothetical protein